ncbi:MULTISPECIES: sensor histidine kinase [Corynebacterium]|uniref:sensor histidine kinase n=1 Tax=Corynebacterium TaxID=1716 RepID=UPI00195C5207|nr:MULTISPECIES: ATP-binding protein [Corynebacterium]MDN8624107.1 histidine kinase [Corynebacterium kroppenstedtii]QRQ64117.1 hypothetical protein I6J23_05490 [Corynebacterium kroppenstedtii]
MAQPHTRTWRNTELLYPAVWLLYLVFPLGACLTADASIFTRAVTSTLVILFGVVYLSVYPNAHGTENNIELKLWGVTGILFVAAAGTYPVTGIFSVCFIPYFCALWVFIRRGQRGTLIGVCVSTVLVTGVLLASPELRHHAGLIVLAVGSGIAIIIGLGVATTDTDRRRELEHQLERARQREAYATAMHDVLSHSLTVIAVKAQLASHLLDSDGDQACRDRARRENDDIYRLSHSALNDMRSALDELSPPSLMETVEEARAVCTSAGISLTVNVDNNLPPVTDSLYAALVKEATTNILQHSEAQSASITATSTKLIITDDGRGFAQEKHNNIYANTLDRHSNQEKPHHVNGVTSAKDNGRQHGLDGMKRRAHNIGASFSIHSTPGEGTTLTVETTPKKTKTRSALLRSPMTQRGKP